MIEHTMSEKEFLLDPKKFEKYTQPDYRLVLLGEKGEVRTVIGYAMPAEPIQELPPDAVGPMDKDAWLR